MNDIGGYPSTDRVTLSEIHRRQADLSGVEPVGLERIKQLRDDDPRFPKPVQTIGRSQYFIWGKVAAYLMERDPRPGRPPTKTRKS